MLRNSKGILKNNYLIIFYLKESLNAEACKRYVANGEFRYCLNIIWISWHRYYSSSPAIAHNLNYSLYYPGHALGLNREILLGWPNIAPLIPILIITTSDWITHHVRSYCRSSCGSDMICEISCTSWPVTIYYILFLSVWFHWFVFCNLGELCLKLF